MFTSPNKRLSSQLEPILLAAVLVIIGALALTAHASLTVSSSGVSGSSSLSFDGSGALSIGTTSATSIAIGSSSIPITIQGSSWSYTGGNLGIGTSTPGQTLTIQGNGTQDIFNVASSSGASDLYVASNGNVGIGTTTPAARLDIQSGSSLNVLNLTTSGTYAQETITSYRNSVTTHGLIEFYAARGTSASPLAVTTGDVLMSLRGEGYNGIGFTNDSVQIEGSADENYTSTNVGGRLAIRTMQDGTNANSLFRFVIDGKGNGCIGTSCSDGSSAMQASTTLEVYDASGNTPGITHLMVREGGSQGTNEAFGVYANNGTSPRLVVQNGSVGISTTSPVANFQVANGSNATTTVEFGSQGQNKGTCIKLYRSDGSAIYASVAAGATTFTLSTTACATVTGF